MLDNYYLGITLLISFGLQAILFAVSFSLQTDKARFCSCLDSKISLCADSWQTRS